MHAIHQFVAGFSRGDAISNEAIVLRRIFRAWGFASEIYCERRCILPELRETARDIRLAARDVGRADVVLLHLSIGSVVNEVFASLACRKAILYHNVTPATYFDLVNRQTASTLARAAPQIRALAAAGEVTLADSRFNADELTAFGYRDVRVFPLALDFESLNAPPDRATLERFGDGKVNVLFVGRGVPNKKIEDVLMAFYHFHRFVEPASRLIHAGSFDGAERYRFLLLAQARMLELDAGDVVLAGSVSQARLNALYRSAHVFLCMSEHEGFCIPLLESMAHDVPVLAYRAAAVPETLGGAGVLFREKAFGAIAEMIGLLARDPALRAAVLERQRQRLAAYRIRDPASELRAHLAPLLPAAGAA